jgi:hypothetical protein
VTPDEVPQEVIDLYEEKTDRQYAIGLTDVDILACILTRYDELKLEAVANYSRRTYPTNQERYAGGLYED